MLRSIYNFFTGKSADTNETTNNISQNPEDQNNNIRKEIPIDDSKLVISDDKITFSVNKVTQNKPPHLVNLKTTFETTQKKLIYHLEYLSKLEVKANPKKMEFLGLGKLHDSSFRNEDSESEIYHISGFPSAINTIIYAYTNHLHLCLSPSDFIIMIGQGLANHINMNAEKLRHNFVDHEGKENIVIITDQVSMKVQSDWSPVIDLFSELVQKRIKKDVYNVVIDDTSTATRTTRVVSELNLMDCMKNYFNYVVIIGCGFPQISLKGKPEDWQKLKDKVNALKEMNSKDCLALDWWLQYLIPVVDKICEAGIERKIDREFWANIYKEYKEYGTVVTGWINAFLPYIYSTTTGYQTNYKWGKMLENFTFRPGVNTADICEGLSKVPFVVEDGGLRYEMHFYSGFLGTKYDKEQDQVESAYFWSVYQDPLPPSVIKPNKK